MKSLFYYNQNSKKNIWDKYFRIFDEKKHPLNKKVMIDGEAFCGNIFDTFVSKDDSVLVNKEIIKA